MRIYGNVSALLTHESDEVEELINRMLGNTTEGGEGSAARARRVGD